MHTMLKVTESAEALDTTTQEACDRNWWYIYIGNIQGRKCLK